MLEKTLSSVMAQKTKGQTVRINKVRDIYIYILVMSILPVCLPGEQNALPDPSHGRVIPHWNRLDKRN